MEPLQRAALLWAVGEQPTEDLPDLATDALVRGLDTQALRELAGIAPDDFWGIKRLFEATVEELGIDLPDKQTALWLLAKHAAAEIVAGTVSPSRGARWIWSEISHRILREGDLRVFIGLTSEWDDHPDSRTEIDAAIVEAAKRLIDQPEPRIWVRIQARHGLSPIADSGTRVEIAPGELSISPRLSDSFAEWAQEYDATFAADGDGFRCAGEAASFVAQGKDLVGRLQSELGGSWRVEYVPEPIKTPGVRLKRGP